MRVKRAHSMWVGTHPNEASPKTQSLERKFPCIRTRKTTAVFATAAGVCDGGHCKGFWGVEGGAPSKFKGGSTGDWGVV